MERIREIVRDGEKKTAILIGDDSFGVPKHLMQGVKRNGIISDGSHLEKWYWDGLCTIDGMRYVYFSPMRIRPLSSLSTDARADALWIVRNLALALESADEDFLDLVTGVLPLYRIWIADEDKVLILPPDLGDIFSVMIPEEEKEASVSRIIQGKAEKNFLLITEMAELLYYAASGVFPFASDAIRGSGYREVPLRLYAELPEKTDGLISFIFHAKSREMRDIMGNGSGGENLSWFLSRSRDLEWPLENRSEEERDEAARKTESSEEYSSYIASRSAKAKRNAFWRVKGTIIIASVIALSVLGLFLYSYLSNILEPPETRDLQPEGIIEAFYDAQSDCMPEVMTTAVKGTTVPQDMEVTNLFVTSRARMAYEAMNPVINVNDWLAAGSPPIEESCMIYGVVLESIEKTGENEYLAHGIWYTPITANEGDEVTPEAGTTVVYKYDVEQSFGFTWNDRGWWNITSSEIVSYDYLGYETVETYARTLQI